MTDSKTTAQPERRTVSFVVEAGHRRLDKVVRDRVPGLSRTQGQKLIEAGEVTVDGHTRDPSYEVKPGQRISVLLPSPKADRPIQPQPIPLDIVYEDDHLLGINKPAGMVVHPAPGHLEGTLVNALLAYYPPIVEAGRRDRAGIVHRLDKDTSGILVVAKRASALRGLQEQFRAREVEKSYLALVHKRIDPPEGIIEVPIGRHPRDRQRMTPLTDGKYARTRYHAVEFFRQHTLLEAHPYTGRTHQLRVHLSWLGYPVVGDSVYSSKRSTLLKDRHFLHAWQLRLTHPATRDSLLLEAPLPHELESVLERLRPARSLRRSQAA